MTSPVQSTTVHHSPVQPTTAKYSPSSSLTFSHPYPRLQKPNSLLRLVHSNLLFGPFVFMSNGVFMNEATCFFVQLWFAEGVFNIDNKFWSLLSLNALNAIPYIGASFLGFLKLFNREYTFGYWTSLIIYLILWHAFTKLSTI